MHLVTQQTRSPAASPAHEQRVGIAADTAIEPRMLLMDAVFPRSMPARGSLHECRHPHATHQTVFMITHDVDEALLLGDKILLMTNGPRAWVAEIVENTLPKDRTRAELHKQPNYYPLRNHLLDFLVTRSRELALNPEVRPQDRNPPVIRPTAQPSHATTPHLSQSPAQAPPAPLPARASQPRKGIFAPTAAGRPRRRALDQAAAQPLRLDANHHEGAHPCDARAD